MNPDCPVERKSEFAHYFKDHPTITFASTYLKIGSSFYYRLGPLQWIWVSGSNIGTELCEHGIMHTIKEHDLTFSSEEDEAIAIMHFGE